MFRLLTTVLLLAMVLPYARTPLCDAASHHGADEHPASAVATGDHAHHLDDATSKDHPAVATLASVVAEEETADCHTQMGCERLVDAWRTAIEDAVVPAPTCPRETSRLSPQPNEVLRRPLAPPPKSV